MAHAHGTLAELAFARVLRRAEGKPASFTNRTAVIEVESSYPNSSNAKAARQLLKDPGYLQSGFFDEGYAMTPFDVDQRPDIGVLSFDRDRIHFHQCPEKFSDNRKDAFIRQTEEVVKQTLMMNFTLDEIFGMIGKPSSVHELAKRIYRIDILQVLEAIESLLSERQC